MPTHWESSKRPLFVRTVVVDGNRHAILSQEDPLVQSAQPNIKASRPGSGRSMESIETRSSQDSINKELCNEGEIELNKGGKKCHRDLQSCLVKLRLVLATQEKRKALNNGVLNQCVGLGNKKRKRALKKNNGKRSCDWHAETQQSNSESTDYQASLPEQDKETTSSKYDNDHITVATFFASEPYSGGHHHNEITAACEIDFRVPDEPKQPPATEPTMLKGLNLSSEFDIPWNTISADNYFTRPFYNRLSERVLQWIDHANKRRNKENTENNEKKTEINKGKILPSTREGKNVKKCLSQRDSSDDNFEEVKNEEDIDTILSRELPKFSEELNKIHGLKAEIPVKQETYAKQLQDSIAESFTNVVSIRSGKYALAPKIKEHEEAKVSAATARRRSFFKRQNRLDESSDDDLPSLDVKQREVDCEKILRQKLLEMKLPIIQQLPAIAPFVPQLSSKLSWLRDSRSNPHWPADLSTPKPQLHIFIPAIDGTNEVSDTESCDSFT